MLHLSMYTVQIATCTVPVLEQIFLQGSSFWTCNIGHSCSWLNQMAPTVDNWQHILQRHLTYQLDTYTQTLLQLQHIMYKH